MNSSLTLLTFNLGLSKKNKFVLETISGDGGELFANCNWQQCIVLSYVTQTLQNPCRTRVSMTWVWDPHLICLTYLGCFDYIYDREV
ncbi:hypothetical protein H5410_059640 [Solanum commersonii]|uniref:Uncharacterized protein n=1 Tax=Solanum commersonii TaxID=4109 RepID=A0A9J5W327_SOLCO|nr:hypothetical protein H5410_059640 [Solanum commersonii]